MAIATDIEVNWRNTIDNTNTIGLSKTLNELGVNVFNNAEFCVGFENPALKLTKESDGYPKSTNAGANDAAFYVVNGVGYSLNSVNTPNGAYFRTLLFSVPINWGWGWDSNLRSNNNTTRIVTKLDLSKNKMYLATAQTEKNARESSAGFTVNESIANTTATGTFMINNTAHKIICGNVYKTDNGYYIKFPYYIDPLYDNFNANYGEGALSNFNYDINSNMMFSASPAIFNNKDWRISTSESGPLIYNISTFNDTAIEAPPDANNPNLKIFGKFSAYMPYYWRVQYTMSVEYWLYIAASYGLLFEWNGTPYKPIITEGYLKGYTNDLTTPSDIDNWVDITGHNINPLPPSPTPTGDVTDKELDMTTLMLSSSAGMVHYYEINKTGTATANQISDAISRFDISTIGKDLMRNMVSFKAFAVLPTSEVFNNIIHVAGKDLKDDNDNYLMGDVIHGMSKLSLGTITIPTLYNDYRDYEPYTRIEMFVPFCGWFPLPSWCMGKTITGEMFVDLYNGTCKAIIKASNTVVAETGGNVAYDIPFVAESTGAKAGAVISSALTTAVSAAGFAATPNIATGAAALSSAANLASAVNSNQTTLKGVLGDGSNVNGLNRCFIKVTRPQSPNGATNIPDSYKHEIGIPTMKEVTISAGDGYIQVMDAKVTGTMTAREKQMIVDGFRHGLNF